MLLIEWLFVLQGLLADEAMDKETRDSILRVLEAMGEPKKRGTLLNPGLTVADRSFTHANLGDKGGGQ